MPSPTFLKTRLKSECAAHKAQCTDSDTMCYCRHKLPLSPRPRYCVHCPSAHVPGKCADHAQGQVGACSHCVTNRTHLVDLPGQSPACVPAYFNLQGPHCVFIPYAGDLPGFPSTGVQADSFQPLPLPAGPLMCMHICLGTELLASQYASLYFVLATARACLRGLHRCW